jgi:hypothetical protein
MGDLRQISVFSENKPGKLEKITEVLAKDGINILAISISSSGGFGVIKFLVDRCEQAYQGLKEKGFTVSLNDVLAIELKDRPGGLNEVAKTLARHRINIENAHVFVVESRKRAFLIVEVSDVGEAKKLLEKEGIHFYNEEEFKK